MVKTWCDKSERIILEDFLTSIEELKIRLINDQITLEQRVEVIDKFEIIMEEVMMGLIEEFCKEGRELSPLFKLWDDYLQRVSLPLKTFIAASRQGKWKTSQSCKAEFLPLLFATNWNVYARYIQASEDSEPV